MEYQFNKGSEWRKWDLHIHTPFTKLSNNYNCDDDVWKIFCKKIEDSDVEVFGITDYFSCDNYFTFIEEHKKYYPNSKKVFFPNIEFRLDVSVNKGAEEVNIHVIFSNEIENLEDQLETFLTKLHTNITIHEAKRSCKSLNSRAQFESAAVNLNEIKNTLKEIFGKNKPYLIVGASNNQGLRADTKSPRKLILTDEIDKKCDAFFGGIQNIDYFLREDRYETDELAKAKPVFSGCDAHSFEDIDNLLGRYNVKKDKEEIVSNITWIKSDLTFEGLKQVLYEPKYRVSISEQKPREPMRKIRSIKLNFPEDTYITRNGSNGKQRFCLTNIKNGLSFSDYFTCLVGGRGTGKSTIINLLGERLNEKTDFFKNNNLLIHNKKYNIEDDIENYITIEGTNEVEFISQGKVENLAEANELTKLIFNERIKEIDPSFLILDKNIKDIIELIDNNVKNLFVIQKKENSIKEKEKEKIKIENIIASVNDEKYLEITNSIALIKKELATIEISKTKYDKLLTSIRDIIQETSIKKDDNEIENRICNIINTLKGIEEINTIEGIIAIKKKEFTETTNRTNTLNQDFLIENKKLEQFFKEKGTSEEAIKDSQNANENLSQIISDINILTSERDLLLEQFKRDLETIKNLKAYYVDYNQLITKNLGIINKRLEIENENILEINFQFSFARDKYKDALFNEFDQMFNSFKPSGVQLIKVKETLYLIEPNEKLLATEYNIFIDEFNQQLDSLGINKNNLYVKMLLEIFNVKTNYIIYQLLIKKHLFDLASYIAIQGFYGKRDLIDCSFGQRCTAVVVTLLMSGVKPLIIDEPEAHLDNRLIADYLVNLIKTKKIDRQIIFATHNSNFVINGDSELIHILDIPNDDIFTNISSTSIENITYREKLLKLEGGRDAFITRENKYGIQN